jgi:hypothetical protein
MRHASREQYSALPEEERAGKYVIGTLTHSNYPEFTEEYQKIIDKAMGKEG